MILSGVLAALTSASVMAQVYSLNAVGYINVQIQSQGVAGASGFQIVADQLWANGAGVNQYISPLLDSQLLDGNHNGVTLYKYDPATGFSGHILSVSAGGGGSSVWSSPTATSTTLNPGEAVFIFSPAGIPNFTLTFVGTVPQTSGSLPAIQIYGPGTYNSVLYSGFQFVSSVVPLSAALNTGLGLVPGNGDTIYMFDPVLGYSGGIYTWTVTGGVGNWSTYPHSPTPAVGQGFFYFTPLPTETWAQSFTVN